MKETEIGLENGSCSPKKRGRPVQIEQAEREELILDAASALLLENRFDQVTMAAVAARAGMSKRTIYEIYGDRASLLGAALARIAGSVFSPLSPEERCLPLRSRLKRLLTTNVIPCLEDNSLELLRAVIAAVRDYPNLAKQMDREFRIRMITMVAAELEKAVASGDLHLPPDRIDAAAEMLFGMASDNPLSRLLNPDIGPVCRAERERRRDLAISIFFDGVETAMAGFAARQGPGAAPGVS